MRIKVRVKPKARREQFEQTGDTTFEIAVKEVALGNAANLRVQRLIAEHFNVPLTSVRFLTGMRSKSKLFEVVQ